MAKNTGTLVTAAIRPNDTTDKIASAYAVEIKGGMHSYADIATRNSIIEERREWGMLAAVYNDATPANNVTWQLKYGAFNTDINENKNWVKFTGTVSGGGGSAYWIDPVIEIRSSEPASPSAGDRYILGASPTGVNWGALVADKVVEWDDVTSAWKQTDPLDGMTARVIDQPNSLYKYDLTTTAWIKESVNQVVSFSATSSNAINYNATDPNVLSYRQDSLYIVQFATANAGATVSINVNGLGQRTVKQQTNAGLLAFTGKDVNPDLMYSLQYDGTFFRLTKPNSDPTLVKYRILSNETVVVPAYQEYLLYGNLEVNGNLNIDPLGKVVIVNGALNIVGGTVSNSSNVQLISLATTAAGAAVKKFSTTLSASSGVAYTIVHNLNTTSVSFSLYDGTTLVDVSGYTLDVTSSNDVTFTPSSTISSASVVIMG